MRDFLDNLIDRHLDATPQIKPRLPSIFEPEVPHGGLDLAIEEQEATTPEETETLRQPPRAAQPVGLSTVTEPMQPIASPAPTVPAREEKPTIKAGLIESAFSLSPREGVKETNSASKPLTLTLSQRGIHERLAKPSSTPIDPVMGRVRQAHPVERKEHIPPNHEATAEKRASDKESLNKPLFSLSPRETLHPSPPSQGGGDEGVRRLNQGLLTPSATLIAPVIPSVAGSERAVSQPEPVINVTIGRIEVRAMVSPPRQTPKPENRSPVMGLEEYLHHRSGGHDR